MNKKKKNTKPKWYKERKPIFVGIDAHKLALRAAKQESMTVKDYVSSLILSDARI